MVAIPKASITQAYIALLLVATPILLAALYHVLNNTDRRGRDRSWSSWADRWYGSSPR
jgi:hypothetical protein